MTDLTVHIATGFWTGSALWLGNSAYRHLTRISHKLPAAAAHGSTMTAPNGKTPDCSMPIQLHRRFTVLHCTGTTLHGLATKFCEICGLTITKTPGQHASSSSPGTPPIIAHMRRWLIFSFACAGWAVIPNFTHRLGLPASVVRHWSMNLFVFHPLLSQRISGGTVIGGAMLLSHLLLQYAVLTGLVIRLRILRAQEAASATAPPAP